MNNIVLIGNLVRDPESKMTQAGVLVAKLNVAVNRRFKNENGEYEADFFTITVWKDRADVCLKYLKKGSKVAISGTLQNSNWTDDNGVKHYSNEIICERIEFLSKKHVENGYVESEDQRQIFEEELPF